MRLVSALLISAATGAVLVPATGTAYAADKDCADFSSQSQAQAWYDSHPGNVDRLDRDNDTKACEDYTGYSSSDSPSSSASTDLPKGGVRAGSGGLAADGTATGLAIGFAAAGALAAGGVVVLRRRARHGS
ncbi:excalibur calcium-binding domain-containing protein [Streptomyces kunmingensis]|uniref:Excalibur calcium-binding domain-containing protein n=1 Tax=Streptomyces kunmingensis TaxID=68225 RepID=A0ABU6CDL6_9ACTN|nr:excalibur calcium-binding domain-containing protein [Streptomyces kunmingensis]MEB3962712.1 excalibur calcium-binding domain-containing protein [Streptomyces kunmingensis]